MYVYKVNAINGTIEKYRGRFSNNKEAIVWYNEHGTKMVVRLCATLFYRWFPTEAEAKVYLNYTIGKKIDKNLDKIQKLYEEIERLEAAKL